MNKTDTAAHTEALTELLAAIAKVDACTHWSLTEPQWWLEMMECERLVRKLLESRKTTA